ncbi:rod shape-determining protein MreC [bacterium]|nr:rod shape-determining protein MreC [bacterium]
MYQKNKKRKKLIIVFCIIFISFFLLFYSLSSNRKIGVIEGFLKDTTVTISKVIMMPFTSLNKEKGIDASKSYLIQKNINVHLEEEIEQLRDALSLNQTLTGYEVVNATVVNRNKSYWYQTLTIDKGKDSGLKENMVVITKNGLIGKLEKVTNKSATVKLITANDVNNKVSVSIATSNGETNAILSGYDKKKNEILVSGVDSNVDINKDDVITTSGLGGMFPRGIYIGKVEAISIDKYGLSKTLAIKTNQNFNSIHYVTILKGEK